MMKLFKYLFFTILIISCSTNIQTHKERLAKVKNIINSSIKSKIYNTSNFKIFAYTKLKNCSNGVANVYIEGDGLSWVTSSKISNDPTPIEPTALKMFMQDSSSCKVYLARPCQYVSSAICSKKYWSSHRFSNEIVNSINEAISSLKSQNNIHKFNLIGYSGGGAVAALIATKRSDINYLITVAGNLDIDYWVKKHNISPLTGSLNPANYSSLLENIKQFHYIGANDRIVGEDEFKSYLSKFNNKSKIKYNILSDYSHSCCWSNNWKNLLNRVLK